MTLGSCVASAPTSERRIVLVTGGAGFIGRPTLPMLMERDYEVWVTRASSGRGDLPSGVREVRADLLNPADLDRLFEKVRPTHLLHLAWDVTHGQYWKSPENLRWVGASLELVRRFAESGGKRAVFAGTCAEYDWSGSGHCVEGETPLKPATLYGVAKNSLHEIVRSYFQQQGLSCAWGRVFFLYGPGENPKRLVPSVVTSILSGQPARCTEGTQLRDFLHVDDVASGFVAMLGSDVQGAVNIASGEPTRLRDVTLRIAELLGRPDLLALGAIPMSPGDPPAITASADRLKGLGWKPRYTLDSGLEQTLAWWRSRR